MPRAHGQSGQVLPLVALLSLALGASSLWVARLGAASAARAKASAVADMSALAGVAGGRRSADAVASANGARVVRFDRVGGDVRVRVEAGPAVATSRARPAGRELGLAPALRAALARAEQLLGRPIPITSGHRSPAEQAALWARRATNPFPVARPGTSKHELGLAVDVPSSFVPTLLRVAPLAGLCRPYPLADPVHFELC
jgi:hypothetical protein